MAAESDEFNVPFDSETNRHFGRPIRATTEPSKTEVKDFFSIAPLPWDPHRILMVNDSTIMPPKKYRVTDGLGGNLEEMYAVLHGCLSIGRLKRAESIIKRLAKLDLPESDIMAMHLEFVRVSVEKVVQNPRDSDTQALHKWFELEIRGKHAFFDGEDDDDYSLLEYMLKASLRESSEKKRDRLVRRYMDLIPSDVRRVVPNQYSILTEEERQLTQNIYEGREINADIHETDEQEQLQEEGNEEAAVLIGQKDSPAPEDYPEVNPTEQKGLGLVALKQTLSLFAKTPADFDPLRLTYEEQKERQMALESNAVLAAIDRWRDENSKLTKMGLNTAIQTKNVGARMWKWQLALEAYIKNELEDIEGNRASGSKYNDELDLDNISMWLNRLPTEQIAAVTILAVMNRLSVTGVDSGIPLSGLIVYVGRAVEDETTALEITKEAKANPTFAAKKKEKYLINLLKSGKRAGKMIDWKPQTSEPDLSVPHFKKTDSWTASHAAKVGAFLVAGLIKTATIPVTRVNPETEEVMTQIQPAFSRLQQVRMGKKVGVVMTNPTLVEQLKREPVHSLLAQHLPMVVQPAPWTGFNVGGFLTYPVKVIRIKGNDKDQRHYADVAIERGDMQHMLKGLDVLGKQSWVINKPVLDTMLKAWNSGEEVANIPSANPNIAEPQPPPPGADPLARSHYHKAVKLVANEKGAIHSQRCFQNFQIEIARSMRNEKFYFPHNMDFRGRAYPVPPLLNHMGADHCRGLLKFGEAKELGERGLKWLKVHLANVFGYDKASLIERERFADDHRDDIYDSAANPLEGKRWWLDAEDPWQTLAACIEMKNAWDSPDPTKFMSSLTVHQDGTCNGLQHYAALGGDEWGARQVNLEPGDRPSDVYTAVAELVKEGIAEDRKVGDPFALVLDGKINRKIVKQTVMTNVYGVTWVGAKTQVKRQLQAAYKDLPNERSLNVDLLAGYVATKIFTGLSTMFGGAHNIQHWLGECANRISSSVTAAQVDRLVKDYDKTLEKIQEIGESIRVPKLNAEAMSQFKSAVIWTTPLQMPVVQPYRTAKSRLVKTCLQQVNLSEPHRSDPISKRKQLQAFPPNFVHSLDATHMILSALKCNELGLNFAAVHDSFWTHAADVDKMNDVLRDAFVQIHSEDIIQRLAAEFEVRYKGCYQLVRVRGGSKVVRRLHTYRKSKAWKNLKQELIGSPKDSREVFEKSKADVKAYELIIERKVAEMLESDDPEVVAKAQQMQTPGRILMEFAAEEDFEVPPELAEMGVGNIPNGDGKPRAGKKVVMEEAVESDEDTLSVDSSEDPSDDIIGNTMHEIEGEDSPQVTSEAKQDEWFHRYATGQKLREGKRPPEMSISTFAWVPLKLPPVPQRGNFDVSRLKESKYFFS